jgi:hypothetical protein
VKAARVAWYAGGVVARASAWIAGVAVFFVGNVHASYVIVAAVVSWAPPQDDLDIEMMRVVAAVLCAVMLAGEVFLYVAANVWWTEHKARILSSPSPLDNLLLRAEASSAQDDERKGGLTPVDEEKTA